MLYFILQRYLFESNSQHKQSALYIAQGCILYYKDTFLKAIHNILVYLSAHNSLYFILQRYLFESNSQPIGAQLTDALSCILYYKDTFLKAIHNTLQLIAQATPLYFILQRYLFESNSQRCYL